MPEAGRLVSEEPPAEGSVTTGISIIEVSIDVRIVVHFPE
jgi:hypothetical protein